MLTADDTARVMNAKQESCAVCDARKALPIVRWLHVPKTGTAFATALFHYMCPRAPPQAAYANGTSPRWPPVELKPFYNRNVSGCGDCSGYRRAAIPGSQCICGVTNCGLLANGTLGDRLPSLPCVHHPARYPQDAGKLVAMFREPRARLLSTFRFLQASMRAKPYEFSGIARRLGIFNVYTKLPDAYNEYMAAARGVNRTTPVEWLVRTRDAALRLSAAQSRLVLGIDLKMPFDSRSLAKLLGVPGRERLAARLRLFAFVGLTERWSDSLCLFHALLGGRARAAELGRARSTDGVADASADTSLTARFERAVDSIDDQADRTLYSMASERFEADLQTMCARCMCERGRRRRVSI
jgi:hypothetical protein